MKKLCDDARLAWQVLGEANFKRKKSETQNMVFRRSLYFVENLNAGEVIEPRHIRKIRPGYGLPPKFLNEIIGRKVTKEIERGTAVEWGLIER